MINRRPVNLLHHNATQINYANLSSGDAYLSCNAGLGNTSIAISNSSRLSQPYTSKLIRREVKSADGHARYKSGANAFNSQITQPTWTHIIGPRRIHVDGGLQGEYSASANEVSTVSIIDRPSITSCCIAEPRLRGIMMFNLGIPHDQSNPEP